MAATKSSEVLAWAQRIVTRREAPPHELLGIGLDASIDDAQNAFHKIARLAHPDMHRSTLNADELERVTWAYATVAAAYQALRVVSRTRTPTLPSAVVAAAVTAATSATGPTAGPRVAARSSHGSRPGQDGPATAPITAPITAAPIAAAPARPSGPITLIPGPPPSMSRTTTRDSWPPATPIVEAPALPPRGAMSPKALVYYRKAEFALKGGDLRGALLNLRLAIAADPSSALLRSAIAEVEAEVNASK